MNPGRAKVEAEGQCRVCGDGDVEHLDAAHLWPRSMGATGFEDPDNIIPLCSRIKGGVGCHDDFDAHQLDVHPLLTSDEWMALVRYTGSVERARDRATGLAPRVNAPEDGPF